MLKAWIIGNLTKDPETATTKAGRPVCRFTIAANGNRKDREGNLVTEYVQVSAFGQLCEVCGRFLAKGRKVAVVGEISGSAYMGRDGNPAYSLQMMADSVEFMGARHDVEGVEPPHENNYQAQQNAYEQAKNTPSGFVEVDSEDELPFDFGGERR